MSLDIYARIITYIVDTQVLIDVIIEFVLNTYLMDIIIQRFFICFYSRKFYIS